MLMPVHPERLTRERDEARKAAACELVLHARTEAERDRLRAALEHLSHNPGTWWSDYAREALRAAVERHLTEPERSAVQRALDRSQTMVHPGVPPDDTPSASPFAVVPPFGEIEPDETTAFHPSHKIVSSGGLCLLALLLLVGCNGDSTPAPAPLPPKTSVTLTWEAPTQNTDGSALTDLSGYDIRYGAAADALTNDIKVSAGLTIYVIDGLSPGTYYFAMDATASDGTVSALSNIVEFKL